MTPFALHGRPDFGMAHDSFPSGTSLGLLDSRKVSHLRP